MLPSGTGTEEGVAQVLLRIIRKLRDHWDIARDPVRYARRIGVTIGEDCFLVGIKQGTFGSEPYLISFGNHVAVASGARFITHDGGTWVLRPKHPSIDVLGRIVLGDNVMIGLNAIILPGVEIGANSVVAAGAVVARSVPPGSVVGGVPARVLCSISDYEASVLPRALHVAHLPAPQREEIFRRTASVRPVPATIDAGTT
jgi:acetyltransferase-like isoleucine patch superfamily enzyme